MKKPLIVCTLCIFYLHLSAQNFNNYQPLRSSGQIPDAFLFLSNKKLDIFKDKGISKKDQKLHINNYFEVNRLFSNGKILFNDAISKYISRIADEILKNQPEIRQQFTFYTVKSTSLKTLTSNRGEIFINIGLLTHVKNEAELAFILCREMQHFFLKHHFNSYTKYNKITNIEDIYRQQDKYEQIISQHNYSKDIETITDKKGLELFLSTQYQLTNIDNILRTLSFEHIPYDNKKFDYKILEVGPITIDEEVKLDSVNDIKPYTNEVLNTYPEVESRSNRIKEIIKGKNNIERRNFIISETMFKEVQQIARFEICHILVQKRKYIEAIYHSFLLQKNYGKTFFNKKIIAQSLYGLAQYKNSGRYGEVLTKTIIQGEMQRVQYLFRWLNKKDLNTLAARYAYDLHKQFPSDIGLFKMAEDMVQDVIIYAIEDEENKDNFFLKKEPNDSFQLQEEISIDTLTSSLLVNNQAVSEEDQEKDISFARIAFINLWEDPVFQQMIANGIKYKREGVYQSSIEQIETNFPLYINPTYLEISIQKKVAQMKWQNTNSKQQQLKSWLLDNGNKLNKKLQVLDIHQLDENSTIEDYNDIVKIHEWIKEISTHKMYMIASTYNDVAPITKKYNTNKFIYTGVFNVKKKTTQEDIISTTLLFTPQTMPLGLYYTLTPRYTSIYFSVIVDFNMQAISMSEVLLNRRKAKNMYIKNYLYSTILDFE